MDRGAGDGDLHLRDRGEQDQGEEHRGGHRGGGDPGPALHAEWARGLFDVYLDHVSMLDNF